MKVKNLQRGTANAAVTGEVTKMRQLIKHMGSTAAFGKRLDEILNGSLTFLQGRARTARSALQQKKRATGLLQGPLKCEGQK